MIDDDDVEFTVFAWPGGGWLLSLIGLALIVWMLVEVSRNKEECAQRHCDHGTAILAEHECLCVEKAVAR